MAAFIVDAVTLHIDLKRQFNVSSDSRIGSSRDNSTGGTLSNVTKGSNSASISSLVATLVPVFVYAAVCMLIFWGFRTKYPRVYSPRTFLSSLEPHERSAKLPTGWFNWIIPLFKVRDRDVLHQSSIDGFLFLRFLKVLSVICLFGACLTWPILFPLHLLGGGGGVQLDSLTFGNVKDPSWYYVHAFLAWIFFGFIMYMISRECVYYINLRQAYLLSPYYAKRLSSRTVLFTCIPEQFRDEARLRKLFGDAVKNVWIPSYSGDLDDLVKERDQTALRLEEAEIELIRLANVERNKVLKKGRGDTEANIYRIDGGSSKAEEATDASTKAVISPPTSSAASPSIDWTDAEAIIMKINPEELKNETATVKTPESQNVNRNSPNANRYESEWGMKRSIPDVRGSVAAQWIPTHWRPSHRPLANYGRKVDTIKWTRNRLKQLSPRIHKLRRLHRSGNARPVAAAFIEFDTLSNAQSAYQTLAHHRPFHMKPHINGIRPEEIVWSSLRMKWWERIIRNFLTTALVAVMVIFWSIPAALIGIISKVDFLTSKVPFLGWIDKLPKPILGILTGLLPAIALSLLMAAVPIILRGIARQAGVPSLSMTELFVQKTYFVFQVVQVFLITTLTSAASAALTEILQNPLGVRELLSENLPKASNFYVSYLILQGMAMSATRVVHLPTLHQAIFGNPKSPRMMSSRWHRLRRVRWGSVFPLFSNMGVIVISYSCIAPVILGFGTVCFYLVYRVYHYNLLYVYSSEIDTRGLLYPHALKQILTGVYLAEICLIGLFGIQSSFGPLILMLMLAIFTFLVHLSINDALSPLLYNLPRSLAVQGLYDDVSHLDDSTYQSPAVENLEDANQYDSDFDPGDPNAVSHEETSTRGVEGAMGYSKITLRFLTSSIQAKLSTTKSGPESSPSFLQKIDFWTSWISPVPTDSKPNFFLKWLHPEIFHDFSVLRDKIPTDLPDPEYTPESLRDAYFPPSFSKINDPVLWIPEDPAGVSRQEVEHTKGVIKITDQSSWLERRREGGVQVKIQIDVDAESPVLRKRVRY